MRVEVRVFVLTRSGTVEGSFAQTVVFQESLLGTPLAVTLFQLTLLPVMFSKRGGAELERSVLRVSHQDDIVPELDLQLKVLMIQELGAKHGDPLLRGAGHQLSPPVLHCHVLVDHYH